MSGPCARGGPSPCDLTKTSCSELLCLPQPLVTRGRREAVESRPLYCAWRVAQGLRASAAGSPSCGGGGLGVGWACAGAWLEVGLRLLPKGLEGPLQSAARPAWHSEPAPSGFLRHTHHAPAPIFASDQMKKHFYGDLNQDQRYSATVHASSGGHMPLRLSLTRTPQPGAWWFFQEDGLRVVPVEFLGRRLHGLTFSALSWAFLPRLGNTLSL